MGKTSNLFKKIRDIKGTFHAKMDSIKDRNGMDLTEAEDIKQTSIILLRHKVSTHLAHDEWQERSGKEHEQCNDC